MAAVGTSNLGNKEPAERRYPQAEALFREALNRLVHDLPGGNPDTVKVEPNIRKTLLNEQPGWFSVNRHYSLIYRLSYNWVILSAKTVGAAKYGIRSRIRARLVLQLRAGR